MGGAALTVERRDGMACLTLARPATGNRLDAPLMAALVEACARVDNDPDVRVVVLAARGPAFSLGLPRGVAWPDPAWPDGVGAVGAVTKPVIAAVAGEARGWAIALALACDVRVVASGSAFVFGGGVEGLVGGGLTQRLTRAVGPARATELLLLGGRLRAPEAAKWGLVSRVVARGAVDRVARAVGRDLAARAPVALRFAKEAVRRALDLPLDAGIGLEHDLYVLLQTTMDRSEGLAAFRERRRPHFVGR